MHIRYAGYKSVNGAISNVYDANGAIVETSEEKVKSILGGMARSLAEEKGGTVTYKRNNRNYRDSDVLGQLNQTNISRDAWYVVWKDPQGRYHTVVFFYTIYIKADPEDALWKVAAYQKRLREQYEPGPEYTSHWNYALNASD